MSTFLALKREALKSINLVKLLTDNLVNSFNRETLKVATFGSHFIKRTQTNYASLADDKKFLSGYEDVPELQNADENVRRIFSLDNASQREKRKVLNKELMKTCNTSKEKEIAKQTISIVNLEDHLQRMRNKDKHNKVYLQWLRDQRMKKLKSIKASDFERYVELIKQLNIEPLPSTHSKYAKYKFRRFKIGVEIKEKKSLAVRKMPPLPKKGDS